MTPQSTVDQVEALRAAHALGAEPPRRMLESIADRWARVALQGPLLAFLGVFWVPVNRSPGARWPVAAYRLERGGEYRVMLVWMDLSGDWRARTLGPKAAAPSERADLPRAIG